MAALARGFSDHHFEQGEGPGNEVGSYSPFQVNYNYYWYSAAYIVSFQRRISALDEFVTGFWKLYNNEIWILGDDELYQYSLS